jgi:hypothetical protein
MVEQRPRLGASLPAISGGEGRLSVIANEAPPQTDEVYQLARVV